MTFAATLETTNDIAKIVLSGELDASTAPIFKAEIDKVASQGIKRLILLMSDLEYLSSAGLRVLIFAKQKLGANVDIYIVDAQPLVIDTLEETGFVQSVIVVDSDRAAEIEV